MLGPTVRRTTLRQTPSVYAKVVLGVDLHEKQAEWVDCLAKNKVGCMGRRFGKTTGEAASGIWFADCHDETEQFIVAPTADQSTIITSYMEQMIAQGSVHIQSRVDRVIHSPFTEIRFRNDSRIHSRSSGSDGKYLRGHGADVVRHDESAYIPAVVIQEVVPPMLASSKYGWRTYIGTSFGLNHFWELYSLGQTDPEYQSFQFPTSWAPHITRSWLDHQRLEMTALQFRVEYGAEFAEDQNAVFPWSLIQSSIDPGIDGEPVAGRRYAVGWDPAEYSDRSGVAVLDTTDKPWLLRRCFDIAGRDYPVQERHVKTICEQYGNARVLLDSTTHAPVLQHLKLAGVKAEGFHFTADSKRELIDGLVLAMEQGMVKFPPLPDLIEELKYYRYELTAAGNIKLGADSRHHDDLVTAVALAVHQARLRRGFGAAGVNLERPRIVVGTPRPVVRR